MPNRRKTRHFTGVAAAHLIVEEQPLAELVRQPMALDVLAQLVDILAVLLARLADVV